MKRITMLVFVFCLCGCGDGDEDIACLAPGIYDCTVVLVGGICRGEMWDSPTTPMDEVPLLNEVKYVDKTSCGHTITTHYNVRQKETVEEKVISTTKFTQTVRYIQNIDTVPPIECENTFHYECVLRKT